MVPHFTRLFAEIDRQTLWREVAPTSGTFVCRTKSSAPGGKKPCGTPGVQARYLSTHSWGITLDMRAGSYPYYTRARSSRGATLRYPPPTVTQIFQDHGFHWGLWFMKGSIKNGKIDLTNSDPHHFQFATGF